MNNYIQKLEKTSRVKYSSQFLLHNNVNEFEQKKKNNVNELFTKF